MLLFTEMFIYTFQFFFVKVGQQQRTWWPRVSSLTC